MNAVVQVHSGADLMAQQVWYCHEFDGVFSERSSDWAPVEAEARKIAVAHDAGVLDRSDRGTGMLRQLRGL